MKKIETDILSILDEKVSLTIKEIQSRLRNEKNESIKYKKLRIILKRLQVNGTVEALPHQRFVLSKEDLSPRIKPSRPPSNYAGNPHKDLDYILEKYGFQVRFPGEVTNEMRRWDLHAQDFDTLVNRQVSFRKSYQHQTVFTIDPERAKDFDDALAIEQTKQGYLVTVHIADVSFFVQEGSYTDEEAERRGNSAYLATHVIPMLPPILTEHLCSLIANVPRFSISVEMNIDKKGGLINYDIQPGIISVSRRLTYEQAQYILDAPQNRMNQEDQKAKPHLEKLNACAQLLTKRRIQNGSLELELPDVAIHYKEDDPAIPDRVEPVNRLDSHRLVEEFMLLANRVVARVLSERGLGIYRIHDAPKAEDLLHFQQVLQQLGIIQTMKRKGKKVNLVSILDEIKGKKESPFIQYLLLRTLTQAFYHPSPSLHFALNFDYYTHFTSPIRRYCDLLVHRLLKRHLHFPIETHSIGPPPHRSKRKGEKLNVRKLRFIAKHISTTERDAEKAEREIVKRKLVYFMKDKIGNTYDGIISGMTDFGFFVAIKPYGIEGLCRLADLPHHYIYDEANYTYYSHQTKQQYKLGDPISIKVVNVDTTRYFIDYMVL